MIARGLFALLLIGASPAEPGRDRRPPVDECAADPSFAAFRDDLRRAVANRDRDQLLALVTEDIAVDFGGGAGHDDFIAEWRLDRPQTSRLWAELETVLDLGCASEDDDMWWSPSLFVQLEDQDDPFTAAIVVRPGAALRTGPDPASPVVAGLDWDVVTLEPDDGADDWVAVATSDGRRGFMARADLRSMVDYRAGFEKEDGRWLMFTFIAGD